MKRSPEETTHATDMTRNGAFCILKKKKISFSMTIKIEMDLNKRVKTVQNENSKLFKK